MHLCNTLAHLNDPLLLVCSLLAGLCSIVLSYRDKHAWALNWLVLSGFLLRVYMAHLDPFLHTWDEEFHALVARNMMSHPFKPMLMVNGWLDNNYTQWSWNHIWLHKQPLFLWQMALSMKIFGASVFAGRYPAVLMQTVGIIMVYRIGHLLTNDKRTAFIASLLTCFSYYQLDLLSGLIGMDQNDAAFDFYVLASIWAYAEFIGKKTLKYAVLVGVFAGCAVLNKWLTGLLVFSGWGVNMLMAIKGGGFKKEAGYLIAALSVCVVVFLPWQLYVFHYFPLEAAYEMQFNSEHIRTAIEGHQGNWLFYIDNFHSYFGKYIWWLSAVGLLVLVFKRRLRGEQMRSVVISFMVAFLFFSFVVETKIASFFMMAAPLAYVLMAVAVSQIFSDDSGRRYLYIPVLIVLGIQLLDLPEIAYQRTFDGKNDYFVNVNASKKRNTETYLAMKGRLPSNVKIVMNAKDYIDLMFYNDQLEAAYGWFLSEENMNRVRKRHVPVAVFYDSTKSEKIPGYIASYDSLYIIPVHLQ